MKIVIKEPGQRAIRIVLPTRLVLNRPSAAIWHTFGGKAASSLPCTKAQLFALIETIHACRRAFPDWTLVEVDSADGERVEVRL